MTTSGDFSEIRDYIRWLHRYEVEFFPLTEKHIRCRTKQLLKHINFVICDQHASVEDKLGLIGLLIDCSEGVDVINKLCKQDGLMPPLLCALDFLTDFECPNHIQLIQGLLTFGANPNKVVDKFLCPMKSALESNKIELVQLLLDSGANIDLLLENDETIFMAAVEAECDINIIELLIARGANVNAVTADGETALGKACSEDRLELVELLLAYSELPTEPIRPENNFTVVQMAQQGRYSKEICQIVLVAKAKESGEDLLLK